MRNVADRIRFVVIEDEPAIRRFLKAGLSEDEAEWFESASGEGGLRLIEEQTPDIVLLDLGLPDIDGLEVLRRLRLRSEVPVIILSARGQELDKVRALDGGADDYLTKPFSVGELMARVRVALRRRRTAPTTPTRLSGGDLRIDLIARRVEIAGEEVRLTATEYRLLELLARSPGLVLTAKHLLREVWGAGFEDSTHTLRVHMANLRSKIEPMPGPNPVLRTEIGVGYRLMVEPD